MIFMLFGPPGIGKSSIIRQLKNSISNFKIRDLEREKGTKERVEVVTLCTKDRCHDYIMGAADVNPALLSSLALRNIVWVTLTMSESEYQERRKKRDAAFPDKSGQQSFAFADFEVSGYPRISIDVSDDIQAVADEVIWNCEIYLLKDKLTL